jgi:hypothetical protein
VYITFGGVKWDYAAVLMVTGFLVTVAGQLLTYHVIATCGRRSVIILAMAVLRRCVRARGTPRLAADRQPLPVTFGHLRLDAACSEPQAFWGAVLPQRTSVGFAMLLYCVVGINWWGWAGWLFNDSIAFTSHRVL